MTSSEHDALHDREKSLSSTRASKDGPTSWNTDRSRSPTTTDARAGSDASTNVAMIAPRQTRMLCTRTRFTADVVS